MKSIVLLVALSLMVISLGLNFAYAFAMHNSTLDINTWIAGDNSTQLHTTDLNRSPISPAVSAGAATAEDTTGPETIDDDLEVELNLMQTVPTIPNAESYFKVNDYDIKVKGENATLQEERRIHSISMDQDTVFFSSLGTLEVESIDEEGIIETQIMPVNGVVEIDRLEKILNKISQLTF